MRNNKTLFKTALLISLLSLSQAHAVITLTFNGTYDTANTTYFADDTATGTPSSLTVFGLSQPSANVSYTFSFNEGATPDILTSGSAVTLINGDPASGTLARTWYAYSTSDLAAVSANVGGSIWDMTDLGGFSSNELVVNGGAGTGKNIWFDQDITVAAPTRAIFDFDNSNGSFTGTTNGFLIAGNAANNAGIVDSDAVALIGQYKANTGNPPFVEAGSTSFTITSTVPEPSRALLLMFGLAGLQLRRKRA